MSAWFVVTLSYLRAGLCGGWMSDLLWWGVGEGSTCEEGIFSEFAGRWSATSLKVWVFCRCFSCILLRRIICLFYVVWCPGGKGLIVTWRHILNCDMTRELMHMGERESIHTCVCIYVSTWTCVFVWMWLFTCAFVCMRQKKINCSLTSACIWA